MIATKVLANLKAPLPLSLPKFLAALGIENFGLQTAKAIVSAGYDSIDKVQAAKLEQLAALPGVGPSKAKAVTEGLKKRKGEIARLLAVGVVPVTKATGGPLAGKTFCFTGALGRPRKELEQMVEDRGGSLLAGVTKELQYLVMADPASGSSKSQKAKQYGTQCLDEAQFMAMVSGSAASKSAGASAGASASAGGGGGSTSASAKPAAKKAPAAKPAAKAKKRTSS